MKTTRYITNKPCPCGAGRTSALATYHFNGINLAADSPVFVGLWGGIVVGCKGCNGERNVSP